MLSSLNHKVLGVLGMVAAPLMLVELLLSRAMGISIGQFGRFEGLLGIIYLAGFLSSVVGMRILRATGKGKVAAALFWIQIAGLLLASCQNVLQLFGHPDLNSRFFRIADAAWPCSHIFMIVIFIAALYAKVWTGWRRFTPLWCGLVLPIAILASPNRRYLAEIFAILSTTAFMLLGFAVRTTAVTSSQVALNTRA
jgi:hypothetical protein